MGKFNVHFNDYVSLAVMLLMIVALIAGQADAEIVKTPVAPLIEGQDKDDRLNVAFDGRLGEHDISITLSVAAEAEYFRSEDE